MAGKEINKEWGEFLKAQMDEKNMNQVELSRLTGIRQDRISRIVRAENKISLQDFVMLGMVLAPDAIRDLYKKAGKNLNIMLTSEFKNPYAFQFSSQADHYRPGHVARLMKIASVNEAPSLCPLRPAPLPFSDLKKVITSSSRKDPRCVSNLCLIVGVGRPTTHSDHYIKSCHHFQYEH